jgi:hypothetical protein
MLHHSRLRAFQLAFVIASPIESIAAERLLFLDPSAVQERRA